MQYEGKETAVFNCGEDIHAVNSNDHGQLKIFMLNKALPVAAHIMSLLAGLGIVIIISYFIE